MKRLISLIKEILINVTVIHHLSPIRMTTVTKKKKTRQKIIVGKGIEKMESLYTVGVSIFF